MNISSKREETSILCERMLYGLVFILVFEGISRKILPPLSLLIFFVKDIICFAAIFIVNRSILPQIIENLRSTWSKLFFLFLPLLIFTGFKDSILAVFATKQYLLYIVVGPLVAVAFPVHKIQSFKKFLFFTAVLLIPTTLVAVMQNALPPSHWLNTSVNGESLEAFSAAGYLRVGSTFSFTAQYSWFLNAESFFLATSFFMPPKINWRLWKLCSPIIYTFLFLMLMIGAFITGGRTAVLGCGSTLSLGFILVGIKRPKWFFSKGMVILAMSVFGLFAVKSVKPEFFMAYDERSAGNDHATHNEELATRISGGFTDWTVGYLEQDISSIVIGNGLGVMSNGANQLSNYAAEIRAKLWTEGDMSTVFWEGGIYLAIIWYGFRIFIVILCFKLWRSIKDKVVSSAASFPLAYIIIHGAIAQLAMQPPLSIWWWLAIGTVIILYYFEKYQVDISKNLENR